MRPREVRLQKGPRGLGLKKDVLNGTYNAISNRSKIRICIQQNLLELKNMSWKILFSLYFFMLFMIFKKNHITKHHFNKSVKLNVYTIHDVKWEALYCQIKLPKYSHISSLIVPNL